MTKNENEIHKRHASKMKIYIWKIDVKKMINAQHTGNTLSGVLGTLFMDISTAKILDFLLTYRDFEYSEADIARKSYVSARQVYRALPILVDGGLVYHSDTQGRKKMYRLDQNSKAVYHLERMAFALLDKKNKMASTPSTLIKEMELNGLPEIV